MEPKFVPIDLKSWSPLYASFHEDNKTFSLMWIEYDEDFLTFYHGYLSNQETYGTQHGILAQTGQTPPPNAYTVSCVPWISFRHFAVHTYENKPYYFPSVEAGKSCQCLFGGAPDGDRYG